MESESQSLPQSGLLLDLDLEPVFSKKSDRPRQKQRRRRRSSARFLRLTGRLMEDIDEKEEEEEEHVESEQNLGDLYKRAIRMNAENRINASNSWNLQLIENIDKFLEDVDESRSTSNPTTEEEDWNQSPLEPSEEIPKHRTSSKEKRVNFTRASCTLDASVRIYSYRVDDVHLASYKVLANLNRTEYIDDNQKKATQRKDSHSQVEGGEDAGIDGDEGRIKAPHKSADTLENNIANINMNKLDSAFDIDPLFHKMSKTFDEGGAKGLLLVNLGVGDKGCNIVFDSKVECEEEGTWANQENTKERNEGTIDISSLLSRLDSIEDMQSIELMSMAPQLAPLREQYAQLNEEGFVAKRNNPSKRYASTQEEEKEADKSIHEEAIERSRASIGVGGSFASQDDGNDDDDTPMFVSDDFGGRDDDADGDAGFDAFIALEDDGARFSSISFHESFASEENNKSQADILLDAICSGNVLGAGRECEFFDTRELEMSMSGNQWAGAEHCSISHWRRSEPVRKHQGKSQAKKPTRTKRKGAICVSFTVRPVLEDILRKPYKGRRGSNTVQMSKSLIATKTKEYHLLPYDIGVGADKLSSLFLRQAFVQLADEKPSANKTVCFDVAVETFGGGLGDGNDDSFGSGDNVDVPFVFADDHDGGDDNHEDDDFIIEEIKGVRKVDTQSVRVGCATLAKKIDVRRLKRDLWAGIEPSMETKPVFADASTEDAGKVGTRVNGLSFQETVQEMEESKTQVDVTLPFYFICVLHLANEKGLRLEPVGLGDFVIRNDLSVTSPSV